MNEIKKYKNGPCSGCHNLGPCEEDCIVMIRSRKKYPNFVRGEDLANEICIGCKKHIRYHFGQKEYRCYEKDTPKENSYTISLELSRLQNIIDDQAEKIEQLELKFVFTENIILESELIASKLRKIEPSIELGLTRLERLDKIVKRVKDCDEKIKALGKCIDIGHSYNDGPTCNKCGHYGPGDKEHKLTLEIKNLKLDAGRYSELIQTNVDMNQHSANRLLEHLEKISETLFCKIPCSPESSCGECGTIRGGVCTGCIARDAIKEYSKDNIFRDVADINNVSLDEFKEAFKLIVPAQGYGRSGWVLPKKEIIYKK